MEGETHRPVEEYVIEKLGNEQMIDALLPELSDTQLIVATYLMEGFSRKEIASHLSCTRQNVEHHVSMIRNKFERQNFDYE